MPFETPLAAGEFDVVNLSAFAVVHEEGPGPHPPTTIIRTDQPWHIHIQCDTVGSATGMITGNWHLHAYLESIGPGPERSLFDPDEHIIPLTPKTPPATVHYHKHPDIRAGVVPAGPYKLIVAVTYIDADGNPGEMAGYWEGPIIQFYNA